MRIAIGSDHAGFALKEAIKAFVAGEYGEVLDVGTHSNESVDYPDYAAAVGAAVCEDRADRGIILCGSGVGASMAANRIPGIRAGLCHDTYSAHQGVEHDDMNVLVLGGRVVGSELARELVEAFLNAKFTGEARHVRRVAKITALACSEAPAGHARWSLRLLADKVVELGYCKRISYVQVNKILKKTR